MYIISKPTSRELHERLAESRAHSNQPVARGVVRRTEEAHDISERIRRETGEEIVLAVSADAPESKQARIELARRAGFTSDPEAVEAVI